MLHSEPSKKRCLISAVTASAGAVLTLAHGFFFLANSSLVTISLTKWYIGGDLGGQLTLHGTISPNTSLFVAPSAEGISREAAMLKVLVQQKPSGVVLSAVWMLFLLSTLTLDVIAVYKCILAHVALAGMPATKLDELSRKGSLAGQEMASPTIEESVHAHHDATVKHRSYTMSHHHPARRATHTALCPAPASFITKLHV